MAAEPPPNRATTSAKTDGLISLEALTHDKAINKSHWWVRDKISQGLIPHTRVGKPPPAGHRDTRPIYFTPEQVEEVKAFLARVPVEYVPASGGAA